MDQRKCKESTENVLEFKSKKILHGVEKSTAVSPAPVQTPGIVGKVNMETKIAFQTPEKTNEPLHPKFKEVILLEKYKSIAKVFDSMNCSLRLLSLRKMSPTFQNICAQVEVLMKRKFSYGHLAQIKYVLPEAIQIDKILVHDKKTLCMKPDMKITLLFDVTEGHQEQSDFMALRQVFASRLINFFTTHPEACDIPKAILPFPFSEKGWIASEDKSCDFPEPILPEPISQRSQTNFLKQLPVDSSIKSLPVSSEIEPMPGSSLVHSSFNRHFSQTVVAETEKVQLLASPISLSTATPDRLNNQDNKMEHPKEFPSLISKYDSWTNPIKSGQQENYPHTCSKTTIINSPVQLVNPECSVNSNASESPLLKVASSADVLMIETPAHLTPKRVMPSCDDKHMSPKSQNCMSYYKPAKRSLDFSCLEGNKSAVDTGIPQSLETEEGNVAGSPALLQKVEENLGCPAMGCKMSPSNLLTGQQVSACLPDLVALIHRIFQSVNCSLITKEELVHKIIADNLDFVERREVEEHIELLEKLVPDWICRKLAPSGDIIYNIKKVPDLNSVQARLINT